MKKLIIWSAAVLMVLGWTACGKDFLERVPENQVPAKDFWKTDADVYNALNGIYGYIGQAEDGIAHIMDGENSLYDDGASDNAHAQYPWESNATIISLGDVTTAMNEGWDYTGIRRANYFLENVDQVTMDSELKERYKAEARFLRAFWYGAMVCKFGDVPLVAKTLEAEASYVPRTPKASVLQFVLGELDAVAKVLPVSYSGGAQNEKGRVTRGAALALKARIHLYFSQWPEALAAAQAVMDLQQYDLFKVNREDGDDLLDDYRKWVTFSGADVEKRFRLGLRSYEKLFWEQNDDNIEVIFSRQHVNQKDAQFINTYLLAADKGGWSSVTPTQELVDAYEDFSTGEPHAPLDAATRAARWKTRKEDGKFYDDYKNRDPRFYASILFDGSPWNALEKSYIFSWVKGGSNVSKTGYNFRKLVDPIAWKANLDNYANHIIIRYAEILLTYAEAKNELSGPDASVYDAVDRIRERAGMPKLDRIRYASKDALREAIRRERRVELALEGHRFMDIRRWKTAPQVMKTIYDLENTLVQARKWTDMLYLMPVPQGEIDLNPALKPNNPGYE